jgi:hypothetical protein
MMKAANFYWQLFQRNGADYINEYNLRFYLVSEAMLFDWVSDWTGWFIILHQ